jgi:Family of unknown function (DUF5652)
MGFSHSQPVLFALLHSPLLPVLIVWELVWKGIGMWKAARHSQKAWYVMILVLSTIGILPITYIFFFQKEKKKK